MIPTFASPTDVMPGQFGPISRTPFARSTWETRQHVEGRHALGDADDQRHAGVGRLEHRVGREGRGDEDARGVRAGLRDRLGDGVEDRHAAVEGRLAALARRDAGDDVRAVLEHRGRVELALAAGDALDQEPRLAVDEDAHAAVPTPRRRDRLRRRVVERVGGDEVGLGEDRLGLLGVGADDADDHRHVARQRLARLDDAAGDLVAAGDAAEDVDEDRPHVRVVEDDPERRGHAIGLGAAADVEEVRRLAAGELDEVHRGHRQAGAVDHAADRAVELDEADAGLARRDLRRLLLVEVAHRLEVGVARERRVVEHDLGVERQRAGRRRSRPAG